MDLFALAYFEQREIEENELLEQDIIKRENRYKEERINREKYFTDTINNKDRYHEMSELELEGEWHAGF